MPPLVGLGLETDDAVVVDDHSVGAVVAVLRVKGGLLQGAVGQGGDEYGGQRQCGGQGGEAGEGTDEGGPCEQAAYRALRGGVKT